MAYRVAILDDYQQAARTFADWSVLGPEAEITTFNAPLPDAATAVSALQGFEVVCAMRERTPFPREVIARLPALQLLVTTGMRNASIDLSAAAERGVTVCGTDSAGHPTAELTFALILELARQVGRENARMKSGASWQSTIGLDLCGKTLGIIGLGRLGGRVATVARAFEMRVLAWSQNLTAARCAELGVIHADKSTLLRESDFISVHLQLGDRSRGLIGAADLSLMKPTAFLINTARGPIVDETALVAALTERRIAGAGLDVFDVEPLPLDHPFRRLDNVVISPHLGYVTADNYRTFYSQTVEAIRAWRDGTPIRKLTP